MAVPENSGITRRHLLGASLAGALTTVVPGSVTRAAQRDRGRRYLVLVELNGGNDGLNTIVPFQDPGYYRMRPRLAIPRDQIIQLDQNLGMPPTMRPLLDAWRDKDLAIALSVGYERPDHSHFRSIEIWNTGSSSDSILQEGWISRLAAEVSGPVGTESPFREGDGLHGVVLGGTLGPLSGSRIRAVSMRRPDRFFKNAAYRVEKETGNVENPALMHLLSVRNDIHRASFEIQNLLVETEKPDLGSSELARQLAFASQMIAADAPIPIIKVTQSGYDTHANQSGRHRRQLTELGNALAAFRNHLKSKRKWDAVIIMTYAEFGRRVAENASGGTDHGTAAPHFLMGGKVKGGFYGSQPSVTNLANGNLKHRLDFRDLYATIAQEWWSLPPVPGTLGAAKPLGCVS